MILINSIRFWRKYINDLTQTIHIELGQFEFKDDLYPWTPLVKVKEEEKKFLTQTQIANTLTRIIAVKIVKFTWN